MKSALESDSQKCKPAAPKPGPEPGTLDDAIFSTLTSAELGDFTLTSEGLSFI